MSTAQDLALGQLRAIFDQDWDRLESLYDPDIDYRDPDGALAGRSAVMDRITSLAAALPDAAHEVRHCTGGTDSVVVEWTLTSGSLSLEVATFYGVRDARISAERNYWDNMALTHPALGSQT